MTSVPLGRACHNCGASLQGRFCADCGQQDRPLDPTLRDVVGDVARELSDLDGRIVLSVRHLFLSPGFLTNEHFRGRRAAWISPVRLYLVFSVAYFAIASLSGTSPFNIDFKVTGDTDAEDRAALQQLGFESEAAVERVATEALTTWLPRAMFVLIPIFGWLVSMVRRKSGRSYPHHLIFALHVFAAFFGLQAMSVGVGYLAGNQLVLGVLGIASIVVAVAYLAIALKVVYGGSIARALLHTIVVFTLYWVAAIAVTALIIVPIVFRR
jgi:hypothetical protein